MESNAKATADEEYQRGDFECGVIWNDDNKKEVEALYDIDIPQKGYPLVFWYDGEEGNVMPRDLFVEMALSLLGALSLYSSDTIEKEYKRVEAA